MSKGKHMSEINLQKLKKQFKAHPWHGVELQADNKGELFNAYIEIVPSDTVKYEVDKESGFLMIDRPHKFSNLMPCLYGLIPQTYSNTLSANFANEKLSRTDLEGDHDPIDICVLTEKEITRGDILVQCRPIGGFRMIDGGEVDDKIIAVLKDDALYGNINELNELPKQVVDRMFHYFVTYKEIPVQDKEPKVSIPQTYGRDEALKVIQLGKEDYDKKFNNEV